jgi:pimeloyl-ACP methyl ester carboxylesterase
VQNPTVSLEGDVAATNMVIDAQSEPVILVGHSYGGAVITEAGTNPKVAALVYISAFLFLDREKFHASFAGDRAEEAAFMADSQVPWGVDALGGAFSDPAWRSKPSWYLVATEDRMIPPPAQREMSAPADTTVVEVAASHSNYVSQPAAVADLIKKAASTVSPAAR